jgi:hypothetical protein
MSFGVDIGRTFDVVLPLGDEPLVRDRDTWLDPPNLAWLTIMVRLRPDQTSSVATAELRRLQSQIRGVTVPESWSTPVRDRYHPDILRSFAERPHTRLHGGHHGRDSAIVRHPARTAWINR